VSSLLTFVGRTDTRAVPVSLLFVLIFSTAPGGSFAYAVVDCFSPGGRRDLNAVTTLTLA